MPFKLINPALYVKSKEIIELDDISEEYVIFLESDKNRTKNSFIIWVIGARDWGKTAFTFNEINIILKDNPKRFVQFLKSPPQLIENIKETCPEELEKRFESIFKTRDIKKNAILVIDEGLLGLNAKESLKIEMRNLGKFLSKSRHPNIIVLINSVNLNILSEFRDMIDIVIYKHCASTFIKNNKGRDVFLEEYSEIITNLREWEGIVVSNYKWFEKFGMISLKYEDWCPWFNDKISRYQKETSSDVVFDETNRIINNNKKIAKQIINEIGFLYHKRGGLDLFCTWLSDIHPDIYYDNQIQLKKIFNFYKYFLDEKNYNLQCYDLEIPNIVMDQSKEDTTCANFFKAYYFYNMPFNKYKKSFLDIIYYWILGFSQRKIAFETGCGLGTVNKLLQQYNLGEALSSDLLRTKTVYEFWIAEITNGKRDGSKSKPDVFYYNKDKEVIGCGECKLIDDISSTITFYQQALGNKGNTKKMTLEPSYNYCKQNNIKCYPLFLRNPKWGNIDLIIPIKVDGDNKITISKANIKDYILRKDIKDFDVHHFFTNQEQIISFI